MVSVSKLVFFFRTLHSTLSVLNLLCIYICQLLPEIIFIMFFHFTLFIIYFPYHFFLTRSVHFRVLSTLFFNFVYYFFFDYTVWQAESQFPNQSVSLYSFNGSRVNIIGPPGKSLFFSFSFLFFFPEVLSILSSCIPSVLQLSYSSQNFPILDLWKFSKLNIVSKLS